MGFVLELQCDATSEAFVQNLMGQLKVMGVPSNLLEKSVLPHVTLLSSETMLAQHTLEKLGKLLENQTAFSLKPQ